MCCYLRKEESFYGMERGKGEGERREKNGE